LGADLSWANLSRSNLLGANLLGSNLSGADLSWADLSWANLSERIVSLSGIGSRKGCTVYNATRDELRCGCFFGTLKEFKEKVNDTHKENFAYLKQYEIAIQLFEFEKSEAQK
jgi:hypothetical protein